MSGNRWGKVLTKNYSLFLLFNRPLKKLCKLYFERNTANQNEFFLNINTTLKKNTFTKQD